MARHTTYSDVQILQGAYDCVRLIGWNKLTVRNVAKQVGCSTQPIYKQYKNMDELKQQILNKVTQDFERCLIENPLDSNCFFNVALNYIDFTKREPHLFEVFWEQEKIGFKQSKESIYFDFIGSFTENLDPKVSKKQGEIIFQTTCATIIGLSKLKLNMTTEITKQMILDMKKGLEYIALIKNKKSYEGMENSYE